MPADRGRESEPAPEIPEPRVEVVETPEGAGETAAAELVDATDPVGAYERIIRGEPGSWDEAVYLDERRRRAPMPVLENGEPAVQTEAYASWYHRQTDRAEVPAPLARDAIGQVPPYVDEPGAKARGLLTHNNGAQIWEAPLASGYEGPAREAGPERLRLPDPRLTVISHVEAHAAADMRAHGLREATLYVNKEPCGGRAGCDRLLPRMLPPDAKLTLYFPGGWRVYRGRPEEDA